MTQGESEKEQGGKTRGKWEERTNNNPVRVKNGTTPKSERKRKNNQKKRFKPGPSQVPLLPFKPNSKGHPLEMISPSHKICLH